MPRVKYMGREHRKKFSLSKKAMWSAPGFKEWYFTKVRPRKPRIKSGGYWRVYSPSHPRANAQGYVIQQRLIMEKYLNRPLKDEEIVHHINHNKLDNRVKNLKVMTHSDHAKIHGRKFLKPYCPPKKVTDEQVIDIREKYSKGGISTEALGEHYHIAQATVSDIVLFKRRTKVGGPRIQSTHRRNVSKLTPQQVIEIREKFSTGYYYQKDLAKEYGVIQQTIHLIVNGKRWKHLLTS